MLGLMSANAAGQSRSAADDLFLARVSGKVAYELCSVVTSRQCEDFLGIVVRAVGEKLTAPSDIPEGLDKLPTPLLSTVLFYVEGPSSGSCSSPELAKQLQRWGASSMEKGRALVAVGVTSDLAVCFNGGVGGQHPINDVVLIWRAGEIYAYILCEDKICTFQLCPPESAFRPGMQPISVNVTGVQRLSVSNFISQLESTLLNIMIYSPAEVYEAFRAAEIDDVESLDETAKQIVAPVR